MIGLPGRKELKLFAELVKGEVKRANKYWLVTIIFAGIYMLFCVADIIILGRILPGNLVSVHVWIAAAIIIMAIHEKED